jgi:hypothetical protein
MRRLHHVSPAYALAQDRFPRISPDEELVLRDYLTTYVNPLLEISIDVPVDGDAASFGGEYVLAIDRMWALIRRRRIDCLVHGRGGDVVVEVKCHATMRAATQVLRYVELYQRERPELIVVPMIICRTYVPGLERVLQANNGALATFPLVGRAAEISA